MRLGRVCDRDGHATVGRGSLCDGGRLGGWETAATSAFFAGEAFAFEAGLDEVFAVAFGAEGFAAGFDAEGVFDGAEAEAAGDAVVEDVDAAVLELDDLAAVDADEMVVGGVVEEVGVVGGLAVAEVDFLEEAGLGEEAEGAVEGGAGAAGLLAAEAVPEFVGGEVLIGGEDGLHEGLALGSVAQALVLDKGIQSVSHLGGHGGTMNRECGLLNIELCLKGKNC